MLRKTQNQNDADDANDAESGIWYRDILKTASQASSASLSSRKNSAGVWGTPQKCACGWPHAMLAKHVYPQNDDKQTRYPHKFVYALKSESLLIHPKILTRKSESVLIHAYNGSTISATVINGYLVSNWERKHILQWSILWFYILGSSGRSPEQRWPIWESWASRLTRLTSGVIPDWAIGISPVALY